MLHNGVKDKKHQGPRIFTPPEKTCAIMVAIDGKLATFSPEKDITIYELALLVNWLICNSQPGIYSPNISYLKEHDLLRHFK